MNNHTKIQCPNCANNILIDAGLLLTGKSFSCVNCNSSVSLSPASYQVTDKAMKEFEKMKCNQQGG